LKRGRAIEAEVIYQVVLQAFPLHLPSLLNLAQLRLKRGDLGTAIELLRRALATGQSSAKVHYLLGSALWDLNLIDEAITHLEKALAIDPQYALAYNSLGVILLMLGQLGPAVEALERSIKLAPREPGFYFSLLAAKRTQPEDPMIGALESLFEGVEALRPTQQVELHFTLGKLYSDIGRLDESFNCFLAGNRLRRSQIVYDEGNSLRDLERVRNLFTADVMRRNGTDGHCSDVPIFIVGMPRCGSTLVEQILASHPDVFGAGEIAGLDIEGGLRVLQADPLSTIRNASGLRESVLHEFGDTYVRRVTALSGGAARVTDKSLNNFRLAGLIHLALPHSRIIHVRRHPVNTCLSCFSHLFRRGQHYTYELGELGRYYCAYDQLMDHWRATLPEGAMIEVQYEDIVADCEGQTRRLLTYCGLGWDPACLEFHKTKRLVRTASAFEVRQPLYSTAVERWRPREDLLHRLIVELKDANSFSGY
jgi:tetratricopeptide (TPR) repeat protein